MQSVHIFNPMAPFFKLPSGNPVGWLSLSDFSNRNLILFFLPEKPHQETFAQIKRFQEHLSEISLQDTDLLAILPIPENVLSHLAEEIELNIRLLSDIDSSITNAFAKLSGKDGKTLPFTALIDATGHVNRIYSSEQYPHLPNPAVLVRALRNLNIVPKALPVTSDDWSIGSTDAQMTLVEYSDYQCQSCMYLHQVLHELFTHYPENFRLIHRHLPMRSSHPLAQIAAEAAEAAGDQGKFWEMNHRLFQAKGELETHQLVTYAKEIGLDVQRFQEDLESRRFKTAVDEDFKAAIGQRIKLPPTLFINGVIYQAQISIERLNDVINSFVKPNNWPEKTGQHGHN